MSFVESISHARTVSLLSLWWILRRQEALPLPKASYWLRTVVFSHDACSFHHGVRVINDAMGHRISCFSTFSPVVIVVLRLLLVFV
jgi:hypothetical protein